MRKLKGYQFVGRGKRMVAEDPIDWGKVTDGSIYRLKKGEDFNGDPTVFASRVHAAARSRGMKAKTQTEAYVVVVAEPKEGEEDREEK